MNCRGVLDALSDYLEGDAGSNVCAMIEEHLKGCKRCRMHIDTMRKVITLYKKWRAEPIPDDVQMRLMSVFLKECAHGNGGTGPSRSSGGTGAASYRSTSKRSRPSPRKRKQARPSKDRSRKPGRDQ
jgi:hypothetical protein